MKKTFSVSTFILAGGLLLQLGTFCFHAPAAAGDVDLSFDASSTVTNAVSVVVAQPDGKVRANWTRRVFAIVGHPEAVLSYEETPLPFPLPNPFHPCST